MLYFSQIITYTPHSALSGAIFFCLHTHTNHDTFTESDLMWQTEQSKRYKILAATVTAVIGFLLIRLAWMQVLQGPQYKKIADDNRIRQVTALAPRGTIYDRNGTVLVANRPSFAISVIPFSYTYDAAETILLAAVTGVDAGEIEKLLAPGRELPYSPVRIKRDADQAMIARIQERKSSLPGVMIEAIPVRQYVYNEQAAHLLGYVGIVNETEYAKLKSKGYHPSDLIGKDGLEWIWEEELRGVDGGLQVEVNAQGEEVGIIGDKTTLPGKSLVLTLDGKIQQAAEAAVAELMTVSKQLGEPAAGGAAIALDIRTGGVLAMVSQPAYNPNGFASGISSKDWNALLANKHNPLTNRVIQNTYPPGSVFKIVTAAAALENNLTTAAEVFDDRGVYVLNGWKFYGWETKGLGKLTVADGLTWSSDPLFYELGRRLGADALASYALTFGFGKTSGIGLVGEEVGVVPTEEWKTAMYGEPWYPGETLIAAIGQGYYTATLMQQALLLAAVANSGTVFKPLLVDRVVSPDGALVTQFRSEVLRTITLRSDVWDTIRQGLVGVTSRGTGAAVFQGLPVAVAGKTGSAETGRGTTHSWFACYAPAEQPEIVVAVLIEEGGEGSVAAAPVVRKILEAYFK